MKKVFQYLLTLLVLSFSPQIVLAGDYYLKFSTSGASHSGSQSLSSNSNAHLSITIVEPDTFPLDGPVHPMGSEIGSWTSFIYSSSITMKGGAGLDNLNFYVSGVPRSVTLFNRNSGTRTVIKKGTVEDLPSAASVLLEDNLVVAPALAFNFDTGAHKVYVGAAMPVKQVPSLINVSLTTGNFGVFTYQGHVKSAKDSCSQGWTESVQSVSEIEIFQALWSSACYISTIYRGALSHEIRFE